MRMLCFHCLLKISEPTLPGVFNQALRSAISTRRDQKINKKHHFRRKLIFERDTFECLPTGYGKSLIFRLAVCVATEFQF